MYVHQQMKKMDEIKEEFCNLLEQNINQIANSGIKIILGDFNAKVGKENVYKPTIGNERLRNETNNNGIKVIQFALSKVLYVRSTTFPHKNVHKETWYSTDGRTANQLDLVLISNRFRSAMTDIRALRGPDTGSVHNLLKNFKVKLRVKTENKYNEKRKTVNIFQNSKWEQEYSIEINNRFEILDNMEDEDNSDNNINKKWVNIKYIKKAMRSLKNNRAAGTDGYIQNW